jgi:Domain of unknown function (DUF6285)
MHDLPSVPALLALARDLLVSELTPLLPEERHADARLVAEAMAVAGRQPGAGDEPAQDLIRDIAALYNHDPQPAPTLTLPRKRGREWEGAERSEEEPEWLRRFARDLRLGAFETSERRARALLWRLTIARLRQSNPNYLAANGFD